MTSIRINVATKINGGLRFGPVCPLIDRRNSFRGQYIAVMGVEHASSVSRNLSDMITIVQQEIDLLASAVHTTSLFMDGINNIADQRQRMLGWGARHFEDRSECPSPAVFEDLMSEANYMAVNYVSGENEKLLRNLIQISENRIAGERSIGIIADQLNYMREVFKDRRLFMQLQNGDETTSFEMIKAALAVLPEKEKVEFQIEDKGGGKVRINMSDSRLFSLFNNMVANGIIHGQEGAPIKVALEAKEGLQFSVTNTGPGIGADYFDLTGEGYPRLFALEKRWHEPWKCYRVPIGSAEIWDIIAISNGWLQVDTSEGETTISGFIPGAGRVFDRGGK